VLSAGPGVAALTGVPAGRLVDRFGAQRMIFSGLIGVGLGSLLLAVVPTRFGIPGYLAPIAVLTSGYALFLAANNTQVMAEVPAEQRGALSGMLNLSRFLGTFTGASVMGAVFALATGTDRVTSAGPDAVATGMRATFGVAAGLMVAALAAAAWSTVHLRRR
jgi:MFS family permease